MRILSIGVRLTLWYVTIFAVAQLVFGFGMWVVLQHYLYDLVDDDLESQVEDLQKFFGAQKDDSLVRLQSGFAESYADHAGDYLQVYAGNGNWIYQSAFMKTHWLAPVEPVQISGLIFEDHWMEGKPLRFATRRFEANGHSYAVQTGVMIADVVDTLAMFRWYLLMFAPLLLLTAATGGHWLSRRALAPVDAIVGTAREIGGTNLSSRLEKLDTGDELQRLSDTLNQMLDRIESAFRRVTEFTADASHELRTPVSLIRTEAELALRRSRGEEQYQEALQHILREAERTSGLIEELLALARADSGQESLKMQVVNVHSVLREAADGWRSVAQMSNLDFRDELGSGELFVRADENALRKVIDILLDNAFKYTTSPGTVSLALEQENERAVIAVRDTGVGIAREEQAKIFERFYRVDKARNRETQGAGLGLSIAQWIVQQHGGMIWVESELGRGAAFYVEMSAIAMPVQNPLRVQTANLGSGSNGPPA
jgi:heavy metal sensor kinase